MTLRQSNEQGHGDVTPKAHDLSKQNELSKISRRGASAGVAVDMTVARADEAPVKAESAEHAEGIPEMTIDNVDEILASDKPVLIEFNMYGCDSCKDLKNVLVKLKSCGAAQVSACQVTVLDRDAKELPGLDKIYEKLGMKDSPKAPRLFVYKKGEGIKPFDIAYFFDLRKPHVKFLLRLRRDFGIKVDYSPLIKEIFDQQLLSDKNYKILSKRFSDEQIVEMVNGLSGPYDDEFVSAVASSDCPKRFTAVEIGWLIMEKMDTKLTNDYSERFSGLDIINFERYKLSPNVVNVYDVRFNAEDISKLYQNGVSGEEASKYDKKLTVDEIIQAKSQNQK